MTSITESELKLKLEYYISNILEYFNKEDIESGSVGCGSSFHDDPIDLFNDNNIHVKIIIYYKNISDTLQVYYFPSDEHAEKYSKSKHSGSRDGDRIRIEYPISNKKFIVGDLEDLKNAMVEYLDFAYSIPIDDIEKENHEKNKYTLDLFNIDFGKNGENIKFDYM